MPNCCFLVDIVKANREAGFTYKSVSVVIKTYIHFFFWKKSCILYSSIRERGFSTSTKHSNQRFIHTMHAWWFTADIWWQIWETAGIIRVTRIRLSYRWCTRNWYIYWHCYGLAHWRLCWSIHWHRCWTVVCKRNSVCCRCIGWDQQIISNSISPL